jgi:L,D-transpeptidase ErfK/SrfK
MRVLILTVILLFGTLSQATIYQLPPRGQDVIGQVRVFTSLEGETLSNIGMDYDVGRNIMEKNNPPFKAEQSLPAGVPVVLPARYILPDYPHKGFVVDISTMRLFYYPAHTNVVMTYPIGIGKPGHMTPLGTTYVTRTKRDPTWTPPASIRAYNKKRGIILPRVIRGGPDNPLGRRAIYLSIPEYLIHATNFPESIGSRGSFGCMRMMEKDIEQMFPWVAKGSKVRIVEQPYLAGWYKGQVYLEIHQPLKENFYKQQAIMAPVMKTLTRLALVHHVTINWPAVELAFQTANGMPTVVSEEAENIVGVAQPASLRELMKGRS